MPPEHVLEKMDSSGVVKGCYRNDRELPLIDHKNEKLRAAQEAGIIVPQYGMCSLGIRGKNCLYSRVGKSSRYSAAIFGGTSVSAPPQTVPQKCHARKDEGGRKKHIRRMAPRLHPQQNKTTNADNTT